MALLLDDSAALAAATQLPLAERWRNAEGDALHIAPRKSAMQP
jgi:hypothetical protein